MDEMRKKNARKMMSLEGVMKYESHEEECCPHMYETDAEKHISLSK